MDKIASFTVNHLKLQTGVYVSRKDYLGDQVLTTFDLRFTRPNTEAPMDNPGIHTIEHLVATFLRNDEEWAPKTIYFGPMGCRTGFYVIFSGDLKSEDIIGVLEGQQILFLPMRAKFRDIHRVTAGTTWTTTWHLLRYT